MSRKDYEKFAVMFANRSAFLRACIRDTLTEKQEYISRLIELRKVAELVEYTFRSDNYRFSVNRFRDACGSLWDTLPE